MLSRGQIGSGLLLLLLASLTAANAGHLGRPCHPLHEHEPLVLIQEILRTPEAYHLRQVRVRGTIRAMEQVPVVGGLPGRRIGYRLTLTDSTGQLRIEARPECCHNMGYGPVPVKALAAGEQIDALVMVSYQTQPGSTDGELSGMLTAVERVNP